MSVWIGANHVLTLGAYLAYNPLAAAAAMMRNHKRLTIPATSAILNIGERSSSMLSFLDYDGGCELCPVASVSITRLLQPF